MICSNYQKKELLALIKHYMCQESMHSSAGPILDKIFRVEKTTEKPMYVRDSLTKEIRLIISNEFKGEKITNYKMILLNYFEIGLIIYPIDGRFDRIIPFLFWTEKEAVPANHIK